MAIESAGDPELSVALSPSLHEWLDERAATLGIEREALLVQLLGTYRAAADLDDDGLVELFERSDLDETIERAVDARYEAENSSLDELETSLDEIDDRIGSVDSRVDDVEAKLANNVEDIRNRVLQLRDAVEGRAPAGHDHDEISDLSEKIDTLSDDFSRFESELGTFAEEFDDVEGRLEEIDTKLNRLARIVVTLKQREEANTDKTARLDRIRRTANRNGTTTATCGNCDKTVQIDLLAEATCPHCQEEFYELDAPKSLLRWFVSPKLTVKREDNEDDATSLADRTDSKEQATLKEADE